MKANDLRLLWFESKFATRWSAELSGKILYGLVAGWRPRLPEIGLDYCNVIEL